MDLYARPRVDHPAVVEFLGRIGVDEGVARDLGGTTSLNLHIPGRSQVVRVHPRFESRRRVDGLRSLRQHLAAEGLLVGRPVPIDGRDVVAVGPYLAEAEEYVDHAKPPPERSSYVWMYGAMGRLHRVLTRVEVALVRPQVATYGPPSSLRRWLARTEREVAADREATEIVAWARALIRQLDRQWIPATSLPCQLIHGDVRLGNVVASGGRQEPVYLDFGFAARRPAVHDLAYSLPWIIIRPDGAGTPEQFDWSMVAELIDAYEHGAQRRLTDAEQRALPAYVASVPLYMAAIAGFTADPGAMLRGDVPFFRLAEWLLSNHIPGLHRPRA